MKILHVEDNRDWLSVIRGLLEDEGHSVISVASVEEARSHINVADVVICDGNLVSDDDELGFDLAQELHAQGRKVLVFASRRRDPRIPYVSKYDADNLMREIARL